MIPARQARKIAIAGATGNLGQQTLQALLSFGIHEITILARPESKGELPTGGKVNVARVAYSDQAALAAALKGHDVLIMQLGIPAVPQSGDLIRAAAAAGVPYVLPTEFGSDPDAKLVDELPEIAAKRQWRNLIEGLGVSSWIGVISNPWYDYCLPLSQFTSIDPIAKKATLWDGGNVKMSFSTLPTVGRATAELVSLPEDQLHQYRNKFFFVSAFHATQRDVLNSVIKATNTRVEDWSVEERPSDEAIARANALPESEEQLKMLIKFFPLHFKAGYGGDLESKAEDLARFGMEEVTLDSVTAHVFQSM